MGNVRDTSEHAGCDSTAGKEVGRENPWTAPSSGQLIPEIPQELGNPCPAHQHLIAGEVTTSFVAAFRTAEANYFGAEAK